MHKDELAEHVELTQQRVLNSLWNQATRHKLYVSSGWRDDGGWSVTTLLGESRKVETVDQRPRVGGRRIQKRRNAMEHGSNPLFGHRPSIFPLQLKTIISPCRPSHPSHVVSERKHAGYFFRHFLWPSPNNFRDIVSHWN